MAEIVAQYSIQHPNDYIGLEKKILEAGGDSVRVAVEGHGSTSATEAQRLHDQAARAKRQPGQVRPMDVPADAFNVAGVWYHVQDQYGEWWTAVGAWDFRDDYVNGSDPGDASGVYAEVPDCWVNDGEYIYAADYEGNPYRGAMTRQNAPLTGSVYDIDDAVSGFVLLTDHGGHILSFKRHKAGCEGEPLQARYYFEHNQDGGGNWGFSISLLGLSLSYSEGAPPSLQKATEVFRT